MSRRPRTAGFRLSTADVMAIATCAVATFFLWKWVGSFAIVAPLALGHFFLFCNVFRIRPRYELTWAGTFIFNFAFWAFVAADERISYLGVLVTQTPITALLIGLELCGERYHGIGCRRINPQLDRYLSGEIK